jgi:hypothetical protein
VGSIVLHRGAHADLEAIWDEDPDSAAKIYALLQEVKGSQALLDALTTHDFGAHATQRFHVSRWLAQQRKGRNLWRLKVWGLNQHGIRYRVVYAFDPRIHRHFILGIVNRDFDYDESDPRTRRILEAYDRLDIPEYH